MAEKVIKIAGECVKVNTTDKVADTLRTLTKKMGVSVFGIWIDGVENLDVETLPNTFADCQTVEIKRLVTSGV